MKISQVNNSQPNFKGGIIAQKGAALIIKRIFPKLAQKAKTVTVKADLPDFDYFLFSETEKALESEVSYTLNYILGMEKAQFSDHFMPKHTMNELIELGYLTL